jgi:outer membrane receptor protein involved in Fe transport
MFVRICFIKPLLCVLFLSLSIGVAHAATLTGTVFDPSGAAVVGAQVSLLSSLSVQDTCESDARGHYQFTDLLSGSYRLAASAPGFSTSSTTIQLANDEKHTFDLRLELSALVQEVVVSASLGGVLTTQLGSSVDVITRWDMNDRAAQSVLEVLRAVPGIEVNQSGRRAGVAGVFVRGGNSNYNLVMIDGMPLNQFGGSFDFAPLATDGLERVEMTRGPQSALYGSNAVTGVINLVSQRGQGPPHLTILAEGGSYATHRTTVGGSGLHGSLGWAVSLSRLDSNGTVPNDNFRNQAAFLSLDYRRNPQRQLDFHFYGNANDAGAPGPYGSDPMHNFSGLDKISRNKQNLFSYHGSYAEQFLPGFRQVIFAGVATNNYYFRSPWGDSYSNNLRAVFNTRSEVTISTKDFLVFGFEYNREQFKNTYVADANLKPFLLPRTSLAFFAENRWIPTRRWIVTAGIRTDSIRTHELPGDGWTRPLIPKSSVNKINPRVALAFLAHDATRLHGSFGTGIRAPSGFELAFTNNPKLRPEKSISMDAGLEQRFLHDRVVVDVTYFYNRFVDQIVTLGGSLSHLSSWNSDNLGNARAQGLETSVRFRPTAALEVGGHYTHLASALLALGDSTAVAAPFHVGQELLRRPKHSAGFYATWRRGPLMLNLNGYMRSGVLDTEPNFGAFGGLFPNKGYVLMNTGFAYRLPRGAQLYGQLNNILNRKYEEVLGYPALRLNFMAGVRLNMPAE